MISVKLLTMINLMIGFAFGTIQSDSGCACVVTKTAVTAPNASASVAAGCSSKVDWTNATSKWCLVDQTAGSCGTFYTGFGHADSCINAGFPGLALVAPVNLEWDQTGYTFYSGQTLVLNWTTRNINSDEWLKLTYLGVGGARTLTTGSGVNSTADTFSVRLSDSANSLATNVPLMLATTTSPSVYSVTPNITILQSKIGTISLYDGNKSVAAGASITSDDRNVTIVWRGIGEAQVGIATVTVRSSGGGGGGGTTVGTALTGLITQGNMSVNYLLPRSFTGGFGGTTYTAQISVQSPGTGVAPYTASSVSFLIAVAPTPSRTATPSTTVTPTPTPSLSTGATASNTPTVSVTPSTTPSLSSSLTPTVSTTASLTSTVSITPTPSQTPAPSLDLAAVAAAATAAANANTAAIVGGIVGTVALVISFFVGRRVYERRLIHLRRLRKLEAAKGSAQNIKNARALYGIHDEESEDGTTVMYQVTMPQQQQTQTQAQSKRNMRQYASGRRIPQRTGV